MKKLILVVTAVLFALSLGVAFAADAPAGPITVTNFGKKAAVTFDHAKHAKVECKDCHHKGFENKEGNKCGDCHKDSSAIKDAMHKKDEGKCYACHLDKKADDNGGKKLKCGDCHAK